MADSIPPDTLVHLAPELVELILSYLTPKELLNFGQTCQRASAFVRPSNKVLWKAAYLQIFDNPLHVWNQLLPSARAKNRDRETKWDWHYEVQRNYLAFNAVCQTSNEALLADPEKVITACQDLIDTASHSTDGDGQCVPRSRNIDFLDRLFRTAPNPEKIIHDYHTDIGSLSLPLEFNFDTTRPMTRSMLLRQAEIPEWASRFHIFYGMTTREEESLRSKGLARGLAYDWTVTGHAAEYGPFLRDGSGAVNWPILEAVMSLMMRIFENAKGTLYRVPKGFKHNIPYLLPLDPSYPDDWAGVNRSWVGTYAFLDYRALVHYNFANNLEYPLDLGSYDEAHGDLMRLKLSLSDPNELQDDSRLQTKLPRGSDLPVLYFTGTSNGRPIRRPSINVRGFAALIPGSRQVRWRFIIRYAGADQWQLDGVQPAGVRSGGIYGLWSHVEHEDHGPTGPFCYFPLEMVGRKTF
ncbi:hypothetical protein EJ04DRAFT_509466 [Polyplosphaeria fusca]|uniref:F-box domain-containing protein n=1 Tax=Polyplosphaeria fusca TaxID=682080 RepID=A0A9P4V3J7_9PLEO|nr:hypothetical protein EJ04DRAFT_509466 [Polyplosphaeria fusca]